MSPMDFWRPSKTYHGFLFWILLVFAKGTDDREFLWHPKYGQCHRKWSQYPIWRPPDEVASRINQLAWSKHRKKTHVRWLLVKQFKLKSWTAWWKNGKKVFMNSVWFKHLWNERKTQSERKQQTCTELLFETHQKWKTETKTFTQTCFWLKQLRLLETAWLSGSYTASISQICKVFR